VRQLRIAAGLTQTALAKRSGMNRAYLSRLESGRQNPTLVTLKRLAKTLEVMPGAFLEERHLLIERIKARPSGAHARAGRVTMTDVETHARLAADYDKLADQTARSANGEAAPKKQRVRLDASRPPA
jgi:transcriptional regulator with XRE-family HTH domain